MLPFRKRLSLDQRCAQFGRVQHRCAEYVPTVLERGDGDVPTVAKEKYLVPRDLTVGQFAYIVRKQLKMDASRALFLLIDNRLHAATTPFSLLYAEHRDPEDGFLYVTYTVEHTFG